MVSVRPGTAGQYVGGLVGYGAQYGYSDVYSTSPINAPNSSNIGGLIGYTYQVSVTTAYAAGKITATFIYLEF